MTTVLAINPGSTTLKYEFIDTASDDLLASGIACGLGSPDASLTHRRAHADDVVVHETMPTYADAITVMFDAFATHGPDTPITAVGHRVVHGGPRFSEPALVDDEVRDAIKRLEPLAPLHNHVTLECIDQVTHQLPETPQVAVFDTAFHSTVPEYARRFAIPPELADRCHLQRYGFHGTSVEYVTARAAALLDRRVDDTNLIVCHLGGGASVTAVRGGRSVDTSMGFAPLGGLVMGSRSGDVDASVVLFLVEQAGMSAREVDELLNHQSGMLGLTGTSDMATVRRRAESGDAAANEALQLAAHRVRGYIGSYLTAVPDLHAIVFTGGVGQHDDVFRSEICTPLAHLGIELDPAANADAVGSAESAVGSGAVEVLVVPTHEEQQIAHHTIAVIGNQEGP